MPSTDFLTQLNLSQRQAVEHFCGPMLVVAGAGSGKTRALTYRVVHLIRHHRVHPENILAVTFTNKAAQEMKDRIEKVFAQEQAEAKYNKPFSALTSEEQIRLRSQVYKNITKYLWVGTFHNLCARILRFDINKYQDEKKRHWDKNFSIFDESDAQSLIKQIVTKQLNLDDKKFEPRSVRYAISNAKNQGMSPLEYQRAEPDYRGRVIAEVYGIYQDNLAANNALDFDDLIRIPVELFRQNEQILAYWYQRFNHILVDEYQDTNRTQYNFIRFLATNGEDPKYIKNWENRSIFVVGDVDQSIYSFRMADYTILLDFQNDFGDGLADEYTQTMIKLEENYRSRENILAVANKLIENNTQRIDKTLKPTRGIGEEIYCYEAENELEEAEFICSKIAEITDQYPDLDLGSFAVLYRTNSQSRSLEEKLIHYDIKYVIIGGLRFYDRKEIKDALAYLRVIANPADTVSLLRIINTPRRGIGKATIDSLLNASSQMGIPLWEIINDQASVNALAGRSSKAVNKFAEVIQHLQDELENLTALEIVERILENSGYIENLKKQDTEDADNRLANLGELCSAVAQFQEDNEDTTLGSFLANASLASNLDNLQDGQEAVSLMTLHSAKGLEFPVVFIVGLEQGLLPHFRSINDPLSLEEERRLCYVGITRAEEQLFFSYATERRQLWGARDATVPSQFLGELPRDLINTNGMKKVIYPSKHQRKNTKNTVGKKSVSNQIKSWQVGDKVMHESFGVGLVTNILGEGHKMSLGIKFGKSKKIIDPKTPSIEKLN